jgi:hypothetical protein
MKNSGKILIVLIGVILLWITFSGRCDKVEQKHARIINYLKSTQEVPAHPDSLEY